MTESTTPQLTEREVEEIEALISGNVKDPATFMFLLSRVPALIRDWRDLTQNLQAHRELAESYKAVLDQREAESAGLRELDQAENEIRGVLDLLGKDAVRARPDGGTEDVYESLAISVSKLLKQRNQAKEDIRILTNGEIYSVMTNSPTSNEHEQPTCWATLSDDELRIVACLFAYCGR